MNKIDSVINISQTKARGYKVYNQNYKSSVTVLREYSILGYILDRYGKKQNKQDAKI